MSEQDTVDRINALLAEMPQDVASHLMQRWHQDAARMADQADEAPPLMRGPEFPWGLKGFNAQTARFACRQPGCPMVYLEFMDELPGPLTLPANFTAEDVSAAISAQASERHQVRLGRLTAVFREHYRTEHPELEEIHGTPAPAAR
ncbi:hypothetical protein ABTY98_38660 [Streptomyces sp. NPDC096040]|uniref:hypothetical protein n=1 Tax=Streptomyces sp. NPDC096040 TaxID=3155541 RepID=UPI00332B1555